MYGRKILMMGKRKCPKHVKYFDKIKFGKFVRLVGFIKKKPLQNCYSKGTS